MAVGHALARAKHEGSIVLSGFVYAECRVHPEATESMIQSYLSHTGITVDCPSPATSLYALAGDRFRAFSERRRSSEEGSPRRILADFLIGAHAVLHADRLLTLDDRFFARNFPELTLLSLPDPAA